MNQKDGIAQDSMQKADALEHAMVQELDKIVVKSAISTTFGREEQPPINQKPGQYHMMGHDPRLPMMSDQPTLIEFFKKRFTSYNHMVQSATLAMKEGFPEKVIMACLLHDIGIAALIRGDHGYWGAQLVEPYVDEEVSWAIRYHQVLRFFPDEAVGYEYPESYIRLFGEDYKPEPYIYQAYEYARNHKWYMTARHITINDFYAFDPNAEVNLDDFVDIIGRHFKQPKEGLGYDHSPVAHMWRTIIFPNRFL